MNKPHEGNHRIHACDERPLFNLLEQARRCMPQEQAASYIDEINRLQELIHKHLIIWRQRPDKISPNTIETVCQFLEALLYRVRNAHHNGFLSKHYREALTHEIKRVTAAVNALKQPHRPERPPQAET
jgi:hypothetical protein